MKIKIKKGNNRSQLICIRPNGTLVKADLGPVVPFHDIAHFVVESTLQLKEGFYGNILKGYTVEELTDREIIKTLGAESFVSEVTTRALQSLCSGACTMEQFLSLIETEFNQFSVNYHLNLPEEKVIEMTIGYKGLIEQWKNLSEGEMLELNFSIN